MPVDSGSQWSSMDFDIESVVSMSDNTMTNPTSTMSARHYVDPWDLENYAYMRRHAECASTTPPHSLTPAQSPAGEPASSTFLYVANAREDFPAMYASHDEQLFCNDRYNGSYSVVPNTRSSTYASHNHMTVTPADSYTGYAQYADLEESSSLDSANSAGSGHYPIYYQRSTRGHVAPPLSPMQLPIKKMDYNQPVYHSPYYTPYASLNCVEYITDIPTMANRKRSNLLPSVSSGNSPIPTYVSRKAMTAKPTPDHFGLSRYGHLQIDYSCNWNSLDRYIGRI